MQGKKAPRRSRADSTQWFEIPGKVLRQDGVIRLRAPATASITDILSALRDGSYSKPFVLDDGLTRRLHFDLQSVQSEMSLKDPDALTFAYTQLMMAFLLFQPNPRHIALVGLGGGSLTRFCYYHLPRAKLTTIEIDREVIDLAEMFELPPAGARMRLVHADAADYFASTDDLYDAVLIDGCDRWGTAPTFCTADFYETLRERLRPGAVVVVNLTGDDTRVQLLLKAVASVFGDRTAVLPTKGGNRVLFALHAAEPFDWRKLMPRAEELEVNHGLEFESFARRLRRQLR